MERHEYPGKIFKCPRGWCCGEVRDDGLIPPPFLAQHDRRRLRRIGIPEETFLKKIDPESGRPYFQLGTGGCTGCNFFDPESKMCTIYKFRPLDCRLFPLDIDIQENALVWIAYFCPCLPSDEDLKSFASYAERRILPLFMHDELWLYANLPNQLYEEGKWKIIRSVHLPKPTRAAD